MLHPWLQAEPTAILATLPEPSVQTGAERRAAWERWQDGLTVPFTLPERLPPLRLLLVLDNLTGHKTPALVLWLVAHGVMPLEVARLLCVSKGHRPCPCMRRSFCSPATSSGGRPWRDNAATSGQPEFGGLRCGPWSR